MAGSQGKASGKKYLVVALLLLLVCVLCAFAGGVLVPALRTRSVISDSAAIAPGNRLEDRPHVFREQGGEEVGIASVTALGGPESAVARIADYLNCPQWLAPKKGVAMGLLAFCGETGLRELFRNTRAQDTARRYAAVESLLLAVARDSRGRWMTHDKAPLLDRRMLPADLREVLRHAEEALQTEAEPRMRLVLALIVCRLTNDFDTLVREAQANLFAENVDGVLHARVLGYLVVANGRPAVIDMAVRSLIHRRDPLVKSMVDVVLAESWLLPPPFTLMRRVEVLLKRGTPEDRVLACRVLGATESEEARALLEPILKTDSDLSVRQAARDALDKIKKAQQEKQAKDKRPVETPAKPD